MIGSLIGLIVIGLIAGLIARTVMGVSPKQGWGFTLGIGIIGSLIGGFLASLLGLYASGFVGRSVIASAGAILLLWLLRRYGR